MEVIHSLLRSQTVGVRPADRLLSDPQLLKLEFGREPVFRGGIDNEKALMDCSQNQVVQEARRVIRDLAPGGYRDRAHSREAEFYPGR